ncbi:MAG: CHAT domain-containing protein [Saprospiraceae bacterium]|nr:CHAT domain-containing protein [Saprospiraceae bacterium]
MIFNANTAANDSLLAVQYHEKADKSWMNVDTCLKYTLIAIPLLKKTKQWNKYQYNLNALSYCYQKKDDFEKMLESNRFAYSEAQRLFDDDHYLRLGALNNLGLALRLKDDYNEALKLYFEALTKIQGQKNELLEGTLLENIGVVFLEIGDYESALNYLENAIPFLNDYFEKKLKHKGHLSYQRVAKTHQFRAEAYKELGNNLAAIKEIEKALIIYNKNEKPLIPFKVDLKLELIDLYLKSGSILQAKAEISELENKFIISDLQKSKLLFSKGLVDFKSNLYKEAIAKFNTALAYFAEGNISNKSETNLFIGLCYLKLNERTEAESYFFKSKTLLLDSNALNFNLDIFNYYSTIIEEYISFDKEENDIDKNIIIKGYIDSYVITSRAVIAQINTQESRLDFISKLKNSNNLILNWLYQNYISTGDKSYLNLALIVIENSKSILLSAQLKEIANSVSGDNDLFSESKLKQFQKKVTRFNQQKLLAEIKGNNELEKSLLDSIYIYKSKFDSEIIKLNVKYPNAVKSLFENETDIRKIQERLESNDVTFLNYFEGKDNYYLLILNGKEVEFIQVKDKNEIQKQVDQVLNSMEFESINALNNFSNSSSQLFNKLFGNQFEKFRSDIIISPDGMLNKLPFSILLKDNLNTHPRSLNYLLHEKSIAYAYSATSCIYLNQARSPSSSLDFIVSRFKGNDQLRGSVFNSLKSSNIRVEKIKGDSLSKEQFFKIGSRTNMLHISSHGEDYDSSYLQPYLILGRENLFMNDLFQSSINAELLTLSACSTNSGLFHQGEGIKSMASAFVMSGAKSVVGTNWNVNDESTDRILDFFYKYALGDNTIDRSLQKAKIEYLENCQDNRVAPYYWAGLTMFGNTTELNLESISFIEKYGLILILLILIILLAFKAITRNQL